MGCFGVSLYGYSLIVVSYLLKHFWVCFLLPFWEPQKKHRRNEKWSWEEKENSWQQEFSTENSRQSLQPHQLLHRLPDRNKNFQTHLKFGCSQPLTDSMEYQNQLKNSPNFSIKVHLFHDILIHDVSLYEK